MGKHTIALIAHDSKKEEMISFVRNHVTGLVEFKLIATRGTGQLISARTGMPVELLQSGPRGGDQQIGAQVVDGKVKAVIFLTDPVMIQTHESNIAAILRVCGIHNVPIATNLATAEALLHYLLEHPAENVDYDWPDSVISEITLAK